VAHQDDVKNTHVFESELVLAQIGHALVLLLRDVARRRLQRTTQILHEGRLARSVGADQAIAVALAELDIDVLEQGFDPELHGDIGGDEHYDSYLKKAAKRRGEFYLFSGG
jgi:hypothetical protein